MLCGVVLGDWVLLAIHGEDPVFGLKPYQLVNWGPFPKLRVVDFLKMVVGRSSVFVVIILHVISK